MATARTQPRTQTRSIGRPARRTTAKPSPRPTGNYLRSRPAKPTPSRFPVRRKQPQQSFATKAGLNALGAAKGIGMAGKKGASKTPNVALLAALGAGAAAFAKKRRGKTGDEVVAPATPATTVAHDPADTAPPVAPVADANGGTTPV